MPDVKHLPLHSKKKKKAGDRKKFILGIDPGTGGLGVNWRNIKSGAMLFQRWDVSVKDGIKYKYKKAHFPQVAAELVSEWPRLKNTKIVSIEKVTHFKNNKDVKEFAECLFNAIKEAYPDCGVHWRNPRTVRKAFGLSVSLPPGYSKMKKEQKKKVDKWAYDKRKAKSAKFIRKLLGEKQYARACAVFTEGKKVNVDQFEACIQGLHAELFPGKLSVTPTKKRKPPKAKGEPTKRQRLLECKVLLPPDRLLKLRSRGK